MNNAATYPAEWEVVPLKSLGEIKSGGTPSRNVPAYWNGTIPWVTPTELTGMSEKYLRETQERITPAGLAASAACLLPAGSLLVTTRATIGSIAIAGLPITTNQGFKNIVPNAGTNSEFFYYCLQTLVPEMYRRAIGSTFQEISKKEFERISTPRPQKPEQTAIAGILDTVDEAIRQTAAVIEKLKKIKSGLLHDLLTRGIDEDGQLRDPIRHPEQFKDSPLGKVPKDWEMQILSFCTDIVMGQSPPGNTYNTQRKGLPLINGPVEFGDRFPTALQWTKFPTKLCKVGDILFCVRGSTTGRMNIANDIYCIGRGVAAIRGLAGVALTGFVEFFLQRLAQRILEEARGSGSTFPNISSTRLALTPILRPPLPEQEAIVKAVSSSDDRVRAEESTLRKLTMMKQGMMQDLLTGRVRVPMRGIN